MAVTILVLAIASLHELVVPLIVAAVAAVLFAPAVDWLQAHRIPRSLGAAACTLMVVAVALFAVGMVVVGVVDRAGELTAQLEEAWIELGRQTTILALESILAAFNVDLDTLSRPLLEGVGAHVGPILGSAVGLISGVLVALVLLYYLLKDGHALVARIVTRGSPTANAQAKRILGHAVGTIRANARGRTILAAVQGIFVTIALWLLGVPLPASVGIVNFVGGFIPFLGAFIGGAFAVLMALSAGGIPLAVAALVVVLFTNRVLENLLEPRLIGSSMKMHPVAVIVATLAGGLIAGLIGLILAAPLVAIISNLLRELRASGYFDNPTDVKPQRLNTGQGE